MTAVKLGTPAPEIAESDSRAQVVAALATVPSLIASSDMPDVPTEGSAWPVWTQTTPDGSLADPSLDTYTVWVLLPAGYSSATVAASDQLRRQVWWALWPVCVVQLSEPATVRFDNQTTMPGLRLRVSMRGQKP